MVLHNGSMWCSNQWQKPNKSTSKTHLPSSFYSRTPLSHPTYPSLASMPCPCTQIYVARPALKLWRNTFGEMKQERRLTEAISIVLKSNVMKFGDVFVRQTLGVAMGINPAPPLATLFFALHKDVIFKKWEHCISFNRQFIDDGITLWIHQPTPEEDELCWTQFQEDINDYHGLEWTFTKRAWSVDFMDMIIYYLCWGFFKTLAPHPFCTS